MRSSRHVRVRGLGAVVLCVSLAAVLALRGTGTASSTTNNDNCLDYAHGSFGPAMELVGKGYHAGVETFSGTVDLLHATIQPAENGEYYNVCPTEVELADAGGNAHNFLFPTASGASRAYRATLSDPSECKVAVVQKEDPLGRGVRRTKCVGSLLTVNITSVYAHAHRVVQDTYCTGLGLVVRKRSKTAHAKREVYKITAIAKVPPANTSPILAQDGTLTIKVARASRSQDLDEGPILLIKQCDR